MIPNPESKPVSRNDIISIIGLLVVSILFLITVAQYKIEPLSSLQQKDIYKQLTGFLLFGFLIYQWYFAFSRRNPTIPVKQKLFTHKLVGLLMPFLLITHTTQSGFAYQTMIWSFFVIHCTVGFLNPDFLRIERASLRVYWFILHISLSIMVSGLSFYHLYVVYYYA